MIDENEKEIVHSIISDAKALKSATALSALPATGHSFQGHGSCLLYRFLFHASRFPCPDGSRGVPAWKSGTVFGHGFPAVPFGLISSVSICSVPSICFSEQIELTELQVALPCQ
jgi:hypothetical protein